MVVVVVVVVVVAAAAAAAAAEAAAAAAAAVLLVTAAFCCAAAAGAGGGGGVVVVVVVVSPSDYFCRDSQNWVFGVSSRRNKMSGFFLLKGSQDGEPSETVDGRLHKSETLFSSLIGLSKFESQ